MDSTVSLYATGIRCECSYHVFGVCLPCIARLFRKITPVKLIWSTSALVSELLSWFPHVRPLRNGSGVPTPSTLRPTVGLNRTRKVIFWTTPPRRSARCCRITCSIISERPSISYKSTICFSPHQLLATAPLDRHEASPERTHGGTGSDFVRYECLTMKILLGLRV